MTNGEKMQEVFPEGKTRKCINGVVFESDGWCHAYDSDWWNAEYKEPTTKNDLGVDCISRADAIGCLAGQIELSPSNVASVHEYLKCVNKRLHDLPSVTPQEPKTGHWIDEGIYADGQSYHSFMCSECGWHHIENKSELVDFKYCPFCGVKMAESEDT